MKSLIITVAGKSTRFNKDTKENVLKCLYYEGSAERSLIYQQVSKAYPYVDEIIIVGGYKYEDLESFVPVYLKDFNDKIRLAYNEHFEDYGSGFSLIRGIGNLSDNCEEVTFIEGDLFFDTDSFVQLLTSEKSILTLNQEPILSNKAVAVYVDETDHIHYIYDTNHSNLFIPVPFKAIYNSGQMWKFANAARVKEILGELSQEQIEGTNLEIIQKYFGELEGNQYDTITIKNWFNCNTVMDYRDACKNLLNK